MNHFQLITLAEFKGSEFWDPEKAGQEWNKDNLILEDITMASEKIDLILGLKLKPLWASWLEATDDDTKEKVDNIKEACERLTLFLLRNGTETQLAMSQSISAGSMYFTTTNREDPNYIPPEVFACLQRTGLMNTEEQINTVRGTKGIGDKFFKFHINGEPDMGAMWKDLVNTFLNRTGVGSSDKSINVNNSGDPLKSIQADLSINFTSPLVSDSIAKAITDSQTFRLLDQRVSTNEDNIENNATAIGENKKAIGTKQDILTSDNAGDNIKITTGDKNQPVINAEIDTDNLEINGDKIKATINGKDRLIKDAISDNENNIGTLNKQVSDNKNAINTKANQSDLDNTNKEVSTRVKGIAAPDKTIATDLDESQFHNHGNSIKAVNLFIEGYYPNMIEYPETITTSKLPKIVNELLDENYLMDVAHPLGQIIQTVKQINDKAWAERTDIPAHYALINISGASLPANKSYDGEIGQGWKVDMTMHYGVSVSATYDYFMLSNYNSHGTISTSGVSDSGATKEAGITFNTSRVSFGTTKAAGLTVFTYEYVGHNSSYAIKRKQEIELATQKLQAELKAKQSQINTVGDEKNEKAN